MTLARKLMNNPGEKTENEDQYRKLAQARQAQALPAGAHIGLYEVDQLVGSGLSNLVYRAHDINTGYIVALKEFFPLKEFVKRASDLSLYCEPSHKDVFEKQRHRNKREAVFLMHFRHPNVVRGYGFLYANNTTYCVMEYIPGKLSRLTGRDEDQLKRVMALILNAVEAIHKIGHVVGDIKPANILLRENGEPVLVDLQTCAYLYPKGVKCPRGPQWGPQSSRQSDIYRLGALAYTMLSLRVNSEDKIVPALEAGKGRYSEKFLRAIDWCLEPDRQNRPPNIAALRAALLDTPSA